MIVVKAALILHLGLVIAVLTVLVIGRAKFTFREFLALLTWPISLPYFIIKSLLPVKKKETVVEAIALEIYEKLTSRPMAEDMLEDEQQCLEIIRKVLARRLSKWLL